MPFKGEMERGGPLEIVRQGCKPTPSKMTTYLLLDSYNTNELLKK